MNFKAQPTGVFAPRTDNEKYEPETGLLKEQNVIKRTVLKLQRLGGDIF